MHGVETTSCDPVLDRARRKPERGELPTRDDAVLPSGEIRDRAVDATHATFPWIFEGKVALVGHAPDPADRIVPSHHGIETDCDARSSCAPLFADRPNPPNRFARRVSDHHEH